MIEGLDGERVDTCVCERGDHGHREMLLIRCL